jgi:hypothetical protein
MKKVSVCVWAPWPKRVADQIEAFSSISDIYAYVGYPSSFGWVKCKILISN